jgi:hypothetical protein
MYVHVYVKCTEGCDTTTVVMINTKRKFLGSDIITATELLLKYFTRLSPYSSHKRDCKSAENIKVFL